jgi:TetR/AcrR family transcriptional regulator, cholesterol catabolism regulator
MREVAERSGVALGTVYRYFSSKEHLYSAALVRWGSSFEPRPGQAVPGDTDEERIRGLLMRAVSAFERRPQMLRAEMALQGTTDPSARILFDEFVDRNERVMLTALKDLRPADGTALVETVNAALGTHLRAWALGRRTLGEVRRSLNRAVDLLFHGVTA